MAERIEIELDDMTSAYLHHHAQQKGTELGVAASDLLQDQVRSDIPYAIDRAVASGRGFWKQTLHCPVKDCEQGFWVAPITPAGEPVSAETVQAAMDDHVREAHA